MPKLSDSMEEAVILRWLKSAGEPFARGEALAEIETDKATVVYEAETDGVIASIVVAGGRRRPRRRADRDARRRRGSRGRPLGRRADAEAGRAANVIDFRSALREALDEALAADDGSIFFGEDVAVAGGVFAVTPGLYEKYGAERVFDTPISELALAGRRVRLRRHRPAAGGRDHVRRLPAARHGQRRQPDVQVLVPDRRRGERPGRDPLRRRGRRPLRRDPLADAGVVVHGHPRDQDRGALDARRREGAAARGDRRRQPGALLRAQAAVRARGRGDGASRSRSAQAAVVREGGDVTLVSAMRGVHECLAAAETLAESGIDAEVIDLRTLRPLDADTILASLEKTNRLVVVEEGPLTGGWAGEVLALAIEQGLGALDDAWRITTPDSPVPYSPPLEDAHLPGAERIAPRSRGGSDERSVDPRSARCTSRRTSGRGCAPSASSSA